MSHSHRADGSRHAHRLDPGRHRALPARHRLRRVSAMVTGFGVTAALTGTVAYALVSATASGSHAVSTGNVQLTMSPTSPSGGLTTAISGMMPTDTVNRYVDLTNASSVTAVNLQLSATTSSTTTLLTDATKGLKVTVTSCTAAWNATAGSCSGTSTTLVTGVTLTSLTAAQTLISGNLASGQFAHLQISLALPDQTETTVDGSIPANGIQNQSITVTWKFSETQRSGVTTQS